MSIEEVVGAPEVESKPESKPEKAEKKSTVKKSPEKKKSSPVKTAKKTANAKSKTKTSAASASSTKGKVKPKRAWRKSTDILAILKRKKTGMTITELAAAVSPGSPRQQKDEKLHRAVIAAAISRMYDKGLVKFLGGDGTKSDGYRYAAK